MMFNSAENLRLYSWGVTPRWDKTIKLSWMTELGLQFWEMLSLGSLPVCIPRDSHGIISLSFSMVHVSQQFFRFSTKMPLHHRGHSGLGNKEKVSFKCLFYLKNIFNV